MDNLDHKVWYKSLGINSNLIGTIVSILGILGVSADPALVDFIVQNLNLGPKHALWITLVFSILGLVGRFRATKRITISPSLDGL